MNKTGIDNIVIRKYTDMDERQWLKCRVVSFLDSSYYNDVLTQREKYSNDESICLVAANNDEIIGLIDIEIENNPGEICVAGNTDNGAVIWHLAVLPEYRRMGIATLLWDSAQEQLTTKGIGHCEVWTQEDEAANRWYSSKGFTNIKEHNWLRCYARPSQNSWFLNKENVGEILGVEEMIFEADISRRDELDKYCYRIDEVRLYAKYF